MIELRRVSYAAGGAPLLSDVSLRAEEGQVLAVVGPSGAGKSTLVRTMSGELSPTSGEVVMGGRPLSDWSLRESARMRAVVSASSDFDMSCSSRRIVALGRSPHHEGHETPNDASIVRFAMAATDTLGFVDRPYASLSAGERLRLHLAQGLAQIWEGQPGRVLVLDDPFAALDPAHQHALLRQIRRIAAGRCAVVCVLSDLNLAFRFADTIAVLQRGRLLAHATPWDVATEELLTEVFGLDAIVIAHPECDCPFVIAGAPAKAVRKDARSSKNLPYDA